MMQTVTPPDVMRRIGCLDGAQVVRTLSDGPTSSNYLVERDANRYVLRIDKPLAAAIGLDRRNEARILRHVAGHRLGPELLHSDPENGHQVTRYIPGESWRRSDLQDLKCLQKLAGLLRKLHALPPVGRETGFRAIIDRYAAVATSAAGQRAAREANRQLKRLGPVSGRQCLCHGDANVGNLIGREAPVLIDWEYAAICDPIYDLAVLAEHHELHHGQVSVLLDICGHDPARDAESLDAFRAFYRRLNRLWELAIECGR